MKRPYFFCFNFLLKKLVSCLFDVYYGMTFDQGGIRNKQRLLSIEHNSDMRTYPSQKGVNDGNHIASKLSANKIHENRALMKRL